MRNQYKAEKEAEHLSDEHFEVIHPIILSQVYVPKKTSLVAPVESNPASVPTKGKSVDPASVISAVNLALALVPTKASVPTTDMEVDPTSVTSVLWSKLDGNTPNGFRSDSAILLQ
jgi:hypothetical protein